MLQTLGKCNRQGVEMGSAVTVRKDERRFFLTSTHDAKSDHSVPIQTGKLVVIADHSGWSSSVGIWKESSTLESTVDWAT
eukprot:814840-Amphidinium_carterae.2